MIDFNRRTCDLLTEVARLMYVGETPTPFDLTQLSIHFLDSGSSTTMVEMIDAEIREMSNGAMKVVYADRELFSLQLSGINRYLAVCSVDDPDRITEAGEGITLFSFGPYEDGLFTVAPLEAGAKPVVLLKPCRRCIHR